MAMRERERSCASLLTTCASTLSTPYTHSRAHVEGSSFVLTPTLMSCGLHSPHSITYWCLRTFSRFRARLFVFAVSAFPLFSLSPMQDFDPKDYPIVLPIDFGTTYSYDLFAGVGRSSCPKFQCYNDTSHARMRLCFSPGYIVHV